MAFLVADDVELVLREKLSDLLRRLIELLILLLIEHLATVRSFHNAAAIDDNDTLRHRAMTEADFLAQYVREPGPARQIDVLVVEEQGTRHADR